MAAPQSAIQYGPVTSIIYINSLDRYSNGVPPPAGSNQTTATDITFPMPGLANIATVQVAASTLANNWWNQVANNQYSAAFYTNIVNLVDLTTGTTYLITIPEQTAAAAAVVNNLGKYVQASAFGGSAASSVSFTVINGSSTSAPV